MTITNQNPEQALDSNAHYELSFVLGEENIDWLKSIIIKHKIAVLSEKPLQKIRLAYPIRRQAQGFLGSFYFDAAPELVPKLFADFKMEKGFLRYVINRLNQFPVKEERRFSPAQKERNFRSDSSSPREMKKPTEPALTNEALEKKIEEIMK